jgi:hypothetical protein
MESILGPLGTAATPGLLYLPRVIARLLKWTVLAGEPEVLEENLPRSHFVHHKSHLPDPRANPGRRGGKPATNRLIYGAALDKFKSQSEIFYTHYWELTSPAIKSVRWKDSFRINLVLFEPSFLLAQQNLNFLPDHNFLPVCYGEKNKTKM